MPGEQLIFRGKVVNIRGKPIGDVWIDIWQADSEGSYDIFGYRLRGHQMTDAEGRFEYKTIVPCEYDAPLTNADGETRMVYRTAHLHVKVKAPQRGTLTTQLYFPGSPVISATAGMATTVSWRSHKRRKARLLSSLSYWGSQTTEQQTAAEFRRPSLMSRLHTFGWGNTRLAVQLTPSASQCSATQWANMRTGTCGNIRARRKRVWPRSHEVISNGDGVGYFEGQRSARRRFQLDAQPIAGRVG